MENTGGGKKKSRKSGKKTNAAAATKISSQMEAALAWFKLSTSERERHYSVMRILLVAPFLFGRKFYSSSWRTLAKDAGILGPSDDVLFSSIRDLELVDMFLYVMDFVKSGLNNEFLLDHIMSLSGQADRLSLSSPPESSWFGMNLSKLTDLYPRFQAKVRFSALLLVVKHVDEHVRALMFDSRDLCEEHRLDCLKNDEAAKELRTNGNSSFKVEDFTEAISYYTRALQLSPFDHILYSNRCIGYLKQSKAMMALIDGRRCIVLQPDWEKGQSRYVQAMMDLGFPDVALKANEEAQQVCKNSVELKKQHGTILTVLSKHDTASSGKRRNAASRAKRPAKGQKLSLYDDMPDLVTDEDDGEDFDAGEDYDASEDYDDESSGSCTSAGSADADISPGKASQPSNPVAAKAAEAHGMKSSSAASADGSSSAVSDAKGDAAEEDDDDDIPDLVAASSDDMDSLPDLTSEDESDTDVKPVKKAESKPGTSKAPEHKSGNGDDNDKTSSTPPSAKPSAASAAKANTPATGSSPGKKGKSSKAAAGYASDDDTDMPELISESSSEGETESIPRAAAAAARSVKPVTLAVSSTANTPQHAAEKTSTATASSKSSKKAGAAVSASGSHVPARKAPGRVTSPMKNGGHAMERSALEHLLAAGSQEMLMQNFARALPHYLEALQATSGNKKLMADRERVVLLYCTAMAYIEMADWDSLLSAGQHLDVIVTKFDSISFPLVYYAQALLCSKFNNYADALETIEKGSAMLRKSSGQLVACKWPCADRIIPESEGGVLNDLFVDLRAVCSNPPRPDAFCRYGECKMRRQVYLTDHDYKGFVQVTCSATCHVEYHLNCWRKVRPCDGEKDILGGPCLTPDCDGIIDGVVINDLGGKSVTRKLRDDTQPLPVKPAAAANSVSGKSRPKTKGRPKVKPQEEEESSGTAVAATVKPKEKAASRQSAAVAGASAAAAGLDSESLTETGVSVQPPTACVDESKMVMLRRDEDDDDGSAVASARVSKSKAKKKKVKNVQTLDEFLGDQYVPRNADGDPLLPVDSGDSLLGPSVPSFTAPPPMFRPPDAVFPPPNVFSTTFSGDLPGAKRQSDYPQLMTVDDVHGGEVSETASTVGSVASTAESEALSNTYSVFSETLRYGGQMTLDDPRLQEVLGYLPDETRVAVEDAGGLRHFLQRSRLFAFRGETVFLREFLASVEESNRKGRVSDAIPIRRQSEPVADDSGAESPALNADANEFVPKALPSGQEEAESGSGDRHTRPVHMPPRVPLGMFELGLPFGPMMPEYPVTALPPAPPPTMPPFHHPQYGPPFGLPLGQPPAAAAGFMPPPPVLNASSPMLAIPPPQVYPDMPNAVSQPQSLAFAAAAAVKPVALGSVGESERAVSDALSSSSSSSTSASKPSPPSTNVSKTKEEDGHAASSTSATSKSKKQKKKAATSEPPADASDVTSLPPDTCDQECQTDPDLDVEARCDRLSEQCSILEQQLSDVNDRQHRQKRQFEMDLGTAQKKTAEAEERVAKLQMELSSLREKHEAEAKNVAEAKRTRQLMRELESREGKLKSDLATSRQECGELRQQVDNDREEFSKQLSLAESRQQDLQGTVEIFKRRSVAGEVVVVEMRRDARLREIEAFGHQTRMLLTQIQRATLAGHTTPPILEQQQHAQKYANQLLACVETIRTKATEQIRSLESGQKELSSLPPLAVQVPQPPRSFMMPPAPPVQQFPQAPPTSRASSAVPGPVDSHPAAARVAPLPGTPPTTGSYEPSPAAFQAGPKLPAAGASSGAAAGGGPMAGKQPATTTSDSVQPPPPMARQTAAAPVAMPTSNVPLLATASGKSGSEKKPNSFEKIINQLTSMYPSHTRQNLVECIRQVRSENHNSLSGISLEEVVRRVKFIIEHQASAPPPGMPTADAISTSAQRLAKRGAGNGHAGRFPPTSAGAAAKASMDELDDCIICCEEMNPGNSLKLDCQHRFHTECIRKWFNEQSTCPTCRSHSLMPDEYPALG